MLNLKYLSKAWLIVPAFLSLLGLAGIVDGFVTWYLFLGDVVEIYAQTRNQLVCWIFGWWVWFDIPSVAIDAFVFYSSLALAARLWMLQIQNQTIGEYDQIKNANTNLSFRRKFRKTLRNVYLSYLYPIKILPSMLLLFQLFWARWKWGLSHPDKGDIFVQYLIYVIYVFGSFIILLFLNWQILSRFAA